MKLNSEMLRLARQLRGFRQGEAAPMLAVEQPVLSRIENGVSEFREELAHKASKRFDFPVEFFSQTFPVYGAPVSVHEPMFRKKSTVTSRDVDASVAEANVRIEHLRKLSEGVDISFSRSLPRLDVEDYHSPEEIAGIVRRHWQLPSGPIRNLTLQCEKAGIFVVHSYLGGSAISGLTMTVPGFQSVIVLNSQMPADRMRFTLAHELGHLVMHRFPTPEMEKEADRFASELLVPSADIKASLIGRRVDLPLLASLKVEWRVSMASLLMKANSLGCLTANQNAYLWKQMSSKGYRLREPVSLDFEKEAPTIIDDLIEVHKGDLGYSRDEIMKLLISNDGDYSTFYEGGLRSVPHSNKVTLIR